MSLAIIALYFLVLTFITIFAYLKVRRSLKYLQDLSRDKIEPALDVLQSSVRKLEEVTDSTTQKVEDFTDIIPETRAKLEELVDLLDMVQSKMRNPLLNSIAAFKAISDKLSKWT
ncbi:MAG: hypothetical protein U9P14_04195 [Gemmatimonadota bacterium]|nr:hypothetical protein [Gemmatimonadota bacterium]